MIKRIFTAIVASTSIVGLASQQAMAGDDQQLLNPISAEISVNDSSSQTPWTPCLKQLNKFGLRCARESKTSIHAMVAEVSSMSPAYSSGLKYGDEIVAVQTKKDSYALTVDRDGKQYSVTLRASDLAQRAFAPETTKLAAAINANGPSFRALESMVDPSSLVGQGDRSSPLQGGVGEHPFPVLEIARVGHDGVIQRALANCWFEASLSAVADTGDGPTKIANMITTSLSGYLVKFPGVSGAVQVTDSQLASGAVADPAKWAAVLEVAETEVYPNNSPARGAMTGNPGVKVGLEMLTGRPVKFFRPEEISASELASLLTSLRAAGKPITVASKGPSEHKQRVQPVMPNHAYSVVGFDRGSGLITLRNPYGLERSRGMGLVENVSQDEIRLDLQTFSSFFRFVAYPE